MKHGMDRIGRDISPARAQRMCLDKRQFLNKAQARDFSLRGAKNYGNSEQKPYKCALCGNFHLTTIKKAPK